MTTIKEEIKYNYMNFYRSECFPKGKFMSDLYKKHSRLANIIEKNRKNIRVSFFESNVDPNLYIVMINSPNDRFLVKVGESHGFPRGFPILWRIGEFMHFYGFRPKFENDEKMEPSMSNAFDNLSKVSFFVKFSGFLGQMIAFRFKGKLFWTVTSKKSADHTSSYIQNIRRVFKTKYHGRDQQFTSMLNSMIDDNWHMCFETHTHDDETHGTRYGTEACIVTTIGQGHHFDLTPANANLLVNATFVEYFSVEETIALCQKYGLDVGSSFRSTGAESVKFMKALEKTRDFMNYTKFIEICKAHGVTITPGTKNHMDVSGEILEGLVLHCVNTNGTKFTVKFKFPIYTCRTFCLRQALHDFGMWPCSTDMKEKILEFCQFWCVSEEGRRHWYQFLCRAVLESQSFQFNDQTGRHIDLANHVLTTAVTSRPEYLTNAPEEFEKAIEENAVATVYVVVGPIGYGKTSFSNALVAALNTKSGKGKWVHVDGDDLDGAATLLLGMERWVASMACITKYLAGGLNVVFSTGGGVLFEPNFKSTKPLKLALRKFIAHTLGITIQMRTVVVGAEVTTEEQIRAIYTGEDHATRVEASIRGRFDRGDWTLSAEEQALIDATEPKKRDKKRLGMMKGFIKKIIKISSGNMRMALALLFFADMSFAVPRVVYGRAIKIPEELLHDCPHRTECLPGEMKVMQIRLALNSVGPIKVGKKERVVKGHLTLLFSGERKCAMTHRKLMEIWDKHLGRMVTGLLVFMPNGFQLVVFPELRDEFHSDNSTHMTINPGKHAPYAMKTVALAIANGHEEVTLDGTTYRFEKATFTDVKMRFNVCFSM